MEIQPECVVGGRLIQETQLDYWYELISDFYEKR